MEGIESAELDYPLVGRLLFKDTPSDSLFPDQWNLENTGQGGGQVGADVNADLGWDITTGDSQIKVAVIGRGIDSQHPELYGRVEGDTNYDQEDDHEMMVVGVLAATGDNIDGIAGMDWDVSIVSEYATNTSELISAIISAGNRGARVINISYGVDSYSQYLYDAMFIEYMSHNVIFVLANPSFEADSPYPNQFGTFVHNVGATDFLDQVPLYSLANPFTDVAAPGGSGVEEEISLITSITYTSGEYPRGAGTSLAAPHSAGLASLMLSMDPDLFPKDISAIQRKTAHLISQNPNLSGAGRIDSYEALRRLQPPFTKTVLHRADGTTENDQWVTFLSDPRPNHGSGTIEAGTYLCDIKAWTASITFDPPYKEPPIAWFRGEGFSHDLVNDPASYNYDWIEENITKYGMTLTTYEYRILEDDGGNPINVSVPNERDGWGHAGPDPLQHIVIIGEPQVLPSQVQNLSGIHVWQPEQIMLEWNRNDPSESVIRYQIMRADGINGTTFYHLTYVDDPGSGTTIQYNDQNMGSADGYRYKVRAENDVGWGLFSNIRTVYRVPTEPRHLDGWFDERRVVVHLRWERNIESEQVDKYWLERAVEEEGFEVIKKNIPNPGSGDVTYDDFVREYQEAEYLRYRVRAHNQIGFGPFCEPLEVDLEIGPERSAANLPAELTLSPNYPNPFNPTTQIKFGLPAATHVRLQIMNIRGQTVRVLVDGEKPAGWFTVTWDGKNESGREVASGIYLYLIEADNKKILKKLTLIR